MLFAVITAAISRHAIASFADSKYFPLTLTFVDLTLSSVTLVAIFVQRGLQLWIQDSLLIEG